MSGYSPTWTSKGSDKLRTLQVTKILMNSIEQVINSIDTSNDEIKEILSRAIANSIYSFFTPHKELAVENQFETLLEFLGWKIISIVRNDDETITLKLGANRFIEREIDNVAYNIIVAGIAKAIGYFIYGKNVIIEQIPSQFDTRQLQIIIKKGEEPIPALLDTQVGVEVSQATSEAVTIAQKQEKERKPHLSTEVLEIKPTIELKFENVFSPILQNYPLATLLPVFHKVLSEVVTSFFSEIEDKQIKEAKSKYSEKNILFLIEFILVTVAETNQKISEIADLVGQYLIKAIVSKTNENLVQYLPREVTSEISRRVSYVEFSAREFCTYSPGEKCTAEKRDLCDFILFMWQGMLKELLPDKKFKLGERISATRRGKFCLAEFLKEE
ncbi:MAG: hypothetical protein ACTSQE_02690 [Candidatus Heimdallarchaeaceae archaeon]